MLVGGLMLLVALLVLVVTWWGLVAAAAAFFITGLGVFRYKQWSWYCAAVSVVPLLLALTSLRSLRVRWKAGRTFWSCW